MSKRKKKKSLKDKQIHFGVNAVKRFKKQYPKQSNVVDFLLKIIITTIVFSILYMLGSFSLIKTNWNTIEPFAFLINGIYLFINSRFKNY